MKKLKLIGLFFISLLLFVPNVKAEETSYRLSMEIDKTEVQINDTLKVKVNMNDLKSSSGITQYKIKLAYDESALELLTVEDSDNWEAPMIENDYLIGTTKNNRPIKVDGRITVYNFKVKNKIGTSLIRIGYFSVLEGTKEIKSTQSLLQRINIQTTTTMTTSSTTTKKTTHKTTTTKRETTTKKATTTSTSTTTSTTTQESTTVSTTEKEMTSGTTTENKSAIASGEKKRSIFWSIISILLFITLAIYFIYERNEK